MPVRLATAAIDGSSFFVTVSFFDETGAPMTPHSPLTWTLIDQAGNVINDRIAVEVEIGNKTSMTIVLHGADLAVTDDTIHLLTVEGTYDSDLENDLEFRDQVEFIVRRLLEAVPPVSP